MTRDADILEILDNMSDREIQDRIKELEAALYLRNEWNAMTREEKDAAWEKAR